MVTWPDLALPPPTLNRPGEGWLPAGVPIWGLAPVLTVVTLYEAAAQPFGLSTGAAKHMP